MPRYTEFKHDKVSLKGRTLIEASAGTGKTYTIESLYLRLLLEAELPVSKILVVTFTEAATADLKRRIREKLLKAVSAFETGETSDQVLRDWLTKAFDRRNAQLLLQKALRDFDQSAIHTIHAFCHRMLQEHAFESSSLFDTELIPDQSKVLMEAVNDYWRGEIYRAAPLAAQYAVEKGFTPDELWRLARAVVAKPIVYLQPGLPARMPGFTMLATLEQDLKQVFDVLAKTWSAARVPVMELLKIDKSLKGNSYRESITKNRALQLDRYLAAGDLLANLDCVMYFSAGRMRSYLKEGFDSPPAHPFFALCDEFVAARERLTTALDDWLLSLRIRLREHCDALLKVRKTQLNVRFYDDLLLDLFEALEAKTGGELAHRMRAAFPAALVDEFQDTDTLQYRIFNKIYADAGSALFLIGDPKQAIYTFRNADIFTYLEASRKADRTLTLDHNWRSSPRLVQAVNTVFGNCRDRGVPPFVFKTIDFAEVQPAIEKIEEGICWEGRPDSAPLKLWLIRRREVSQFMGKEQAIAHIAGLVAAEVNRLILAGRAGSATIEKRPLTGEDIAVLVRTHRQAAAIQEQLRARNVPCVLYTQESVLISEEALDLRRVLAAVADPADDDKVKAALVTTMMGLSGDQLMVEFDDEAQWEKRLQSFDAWRDIWLARGFMKMARALMFQMGVRARLLAAPDGARRVTNLLHCIELLNQAIMREDLGMEGALKWLADGYSGRDEVVAEERQLRLESDETAVRVLTLHASKGLEFPIVFCPFNWHVPERKVDSSGLAYHDPDNEYWPVRDLSPQPSERAKNQASDERLAEDVRLLYVGMTRAKHCCYVAWGGFSGAEDSSLAYLFHPGEKLYFKSRSNDKIPATEDSKLWESLKILQKKAQDAIEIVGIGDEKGQDGQGAIEPPSSAEALACRYFKGHIRRDWGITSYSALVSSRHRQSEDPDRDDTAIAPTTPGVSLPVPDSSLMDFPRGMRAGTVLHEILEAVDFSNASGEPAQELVSQKLSAYGFDLAWKAAVLKMLREVSGLPLGNGSRPFKLRELDRKDRITELDFTLPLEGATIHNLQHAFAPCQSLVFPEDWPALLEKIEFIPERGLLKGFIDAAVRVQGRYFLIDWKSNFLGDRVEDYAIARLRETMTREYYFLQYHLYAVALDRLLKMRLGADVYSYDRNFGGVIYLFLRGVRSEWGEASGVFQHRPEEALIRELDRSLFREK